MIYSFLYLVVVSFSSVFIEKLYFSISPLFSLLITASIATVFFNIINFRSLKLMYSECWKQKGLWLGIMITILVMWNCSMIAPGLIGASLYNFIYFSCMGMIGFLSLAMTDFDKNRVKLYFAIGIFVLMSIVVGNELFNVFSSKRLFGILLGVIGGMSSFVYFKQSQAITKKMKLAATQILAVRFYLTIIVLFIVLPPHSFATYATPTNMFSLVILAFLSLIIPLFFQQKALEIITSEQNAIIMSLSPVSIAFLEEIIFRDVNFHYVIAYVAYSLIIALSYFMNKRQKGVVKP